MMQSVVHTGFLIFMIQNIPVSVILTQVCSDEISVNIVNSLILCLIPYHSQKGTTPNTPGSSEAFSKPHGWGTEFPSQKTGSLFQITVIR